jgi:hypothetical protein
VASGLVEITEIDKFVGFKREIIEANRFFTLE